MLEVLTHLLAARRDHIESPPPSALRPPRRDGSRKAGASCIARGERLRRDGPSSSRPRSSGSSRPNAPHASCTREPVFIAAQVTRRPVGRYTLHSGLVVHVGHNSRDIDMLNEIFAKGCYEPPPGDPAYALQGGDSARVLDLDGNVGLFAGYALGRWNVSQVQSFEPDPENARLLRATIDANVFASTWLLEETAASNKAGTLEFVSGRFLESRMAHAGENAVMCRQSICTRSITMSITSRWT